MRSLGGKFLKQPEPLMRHDEFFVNLDGVILILTSYIVWFIEYELS